MLNYLWAGMILVGIVYAAFTGNMEAVGDGAIESARDAVTLCITMLGVLGLWCGMMEVAKESGLLRKMERMLSPFLSWLFPGIPKEHAARKHIAANTVANILGLGWAATPAGLKAMESLQQLNKEKRTASHEMCAFLVLNISSLQLIPVNMIAYRSQYGSPNPAAIVLPCILATTASTLAGIIFIKIMEKFLAISRK